MKIYGVTGCKNTGKTGLIERLVKEFVIRGVTVSTIKHAHHDFDIDKENTDSYMHRKAGSEQIIISSSKRWAKIFELKNSKEKTLSELIEELDKPDIVIVEGYKNDNHLKIEVIKDAMDPSSYLFKNKNNVIALITETKINSFNNKQFNKNQINDIVNYILDYSK